MSEKTHDATDKRLRDMREKGQVARSQDVGRMLVLAVVAETLLGLRADMFELMQTLLQFSLTRIGRDFSQVGTEALWYIGRQIFSGALMIVLIAAVVRLVADSLQFGWIFAPKALKLNFDKLDPTKKIQQMFGKAQIWELLGMIIKLGILIGVGLMALQTMIVPITKLVYGTFLDSIWEMLARVLIWQVRFSSMALIAMAGADVLMQKKMHRENSRMDFQELKQEMREGDGDPEAKMARRHMGQEWLEEEPNSSVRPPTPAQDILGHTDLLVTNPTHIAIALSYQGGRHPLPVVIYKIKDGVALDFIHMARAQGIFVQRDPWLARHLFAHCRVGDAITYKAILPVAEYYREVMYRRPYRPAPLKKPGD